MSQLGKGSDVVPYPLDPEPAEASETEAPLGPPEETDVADQLATVGPAIEQPDNLDLQSISAEIDPPAEDAEPADIDLPEPTLDGQPRRPPGLAPGSFQVPSVESQRSPLENMTGMLGTGEQQVPDFRTQIRDIIDPAFREMSFEFTRQMQEALVDVSNGMERRHLI